MLNLTIKITVAIPFKHKTSTQSCFNVGLTSQTMIQQRDKSICVLGTLNTIPFDKQYLFERTKDQ